MQNSADQPALRRAFLFFFFPPRWLVIRLSVIREVNVDTTIRRVSLKASYAQRVQKKKAVRGKLSVCIPAVSKSNAGNVMDGTVLLIER